MRTITNKEDFELAKLNKEIFISDEQFIKDNEEFFREEFVKEAKKWLGAKYHHLAQLQYKACDCMTFVVMVLKSCGLIQDFEVPYYPQDFLFHRGEETYLKGFQKYGYKTDEYKSGNVILYKIGRVISHTAFITDYPQIIHSVINKGVILDDATQDCWKKYEYAIYSFWGN